MAKSTSTKARGAGPLAVPDRPAENMTGARAIDLPTYLARIIPAYGHPGWLEATRWRQIVRNQPLCITCRDTLIDNLKAMEWDLVPADPEMTGQKEIKRAIEYYGTLFENAEGDFDSYLDLMGQDLMDLPFGAACEIGREDDAPEGPILWINHIDGSTLLPSYDPDYPVIQSVPGMIGQAIAFPKHAIDRIIYTPRPELRRKGWGMAPPEKVYLAVEMLFRGDTYYWKLLLDTPEAGILDLIDMSEDAANQWLNGFRELFQGIDGFKVPVLHSHEHPAVWIPFNRPPTDLLYDKTILHYGSILAAGYGMRLGDLGIGGTSGRGTLAGVIREERQTRRSGLANLREKFRNHFNRLLPKDPTTGTRLISFVWIERDDETMVSRGRALLALAQGHQAMIGAGIISAEEARKEIVAEGIFETDLDPTKVPPPPPNPLAGLAGAGGPGGPGGQPKLNAPGTQNEKAKVAPEGGATPPGQGGRGDMPAPVGKSMTIGDRIRNFINRGEKPGVAYGKNPATKDAAELMRMMSEIIAPGLNRIPERAAAVEKARILKLVSVATKSMVPQVGPIIKSLTNDDLEDWWIPEFMAFAFDEASELNEELILRQHDDETKAMLEGVLDGEDWWQSADAVDKVSIADLYAAGYSRGAADQALAIAKSLYVQGMLTSPDVSIDFNLTNERTLAILDGRAGDLVTLIDSGTKSFIKRIVVSGVNQGLSSPEIAQALRDGATAERVLADEGFLQSVIDQIMSGLTEMSEARTNSIVNYEVAWAENAGRHGQMAEVGLQTKAWAHLGDRGYTEHGNLHPCLICEANEAEGWVPLDYLFETVFEPSLFPPAHPGVCHCTTLFNPDELAALVSSGDFAPWLGD